MKGTGVRLRRRRALQSCRLAARATCRALPRTVASAVQAVRITEQSRRNIQQTRLVVVVCLPLVARSKGIAPTVRANRRHPGSRIAQSREERRTSCGHLLASSESVPEVESPEAEEGKADYGSRDQEGRQDHRDHDCTRARHVRQWRFTPRYQVKLFGMLTGHEEHLDRVVQNRLQVLHLLRVLHFGVFAEAVQNVAQRCCGDEPISLKTCFRIDGEGVRHTLVPPAERCSKNTPG